MSSIKHDVKISKQTRNDLPAIVKTVSAALTSTQHKHEAYRQYQKVKHQLIHTVQPSAAPISRPRMIAWRPQRIAQTITSTGRSINIDNRIVQHTTKQNKKKNDTTTTDHDDERDSTDREDDEEGLIDVAAQQAPLRQPDRSQHADFGRGRMYG
jgi:hypothetical protein